MEPCPFCGGVREYYALLMTYFQTEKEDAIAAWNTWGGDKTLSLLEGAKG